MDAHTTADVAPELVGRVRRLVGASLRKALASVNLPGGPEPPIPGGMLRTRLAARLARGQDGALTECVCAAAEIAHIATVCHDNVPDGAAAQVTGPTLWRGEGPSRAVLMGDMLLCEALELIVALSHGRYILPFTQKVQETCRAAAERELLGPERMVEEQTIVRLARGQGGGLFGFVAQVCNGTDPAMSQALEEAGYRIGTACHLSEELPGIERHDPAVGASVRAEIARQCASAVGCLAGWPAARQSVAVFLTRDMGQPLER